MSDERVIIILILLLALAIALLGIGLLILGSRIPPPEALWWTPLLP